MPGYSSEFFYPITDLANPMPLCLSLNELQEAHAGSVRAVVGAFYSLEQPYSDDEEAEEDEEASGQKGHRMHVTGAEHFSLSCSLLFATVALYSSCDHSGLVGGASQYSPTF